MPALLEIQRAFLRSLVQGDDAALASHVVGAGLPPTERIAVYRDTFIGTLTAALRLSYPAVHRLVGAEFFESAARIHIERSPPSSAWLDEYGGDFPDFLEGFEPAAGLGYLPGVARLEWAVERALHAGDREPLNITSLSGVAPVDRGRIAFVAHPSLMLVREPWPVDDIWRAVLAQDAAAMAAVDLDAGPVHLLVRLSERGVDVIRLDELGWRFAKALQAGLTLEEAIGCAPELDAAPVLAELLGCFAGFELATPRYEEKTA